MIKGIDLSGNNSGVKYDVLAKAGVGFAILKIGQGGVQSSGLAAHYPACKNAGMKIGGYYFAQDTGGVWDGEKDARDCLAIIKKAGIKPDLPIYIDAEDYVAGAGGITAKCNKSTLIKGIIDFCAAITAAGFKAGYYTSPGFMAARLDFAQLKHLDLWLAHWTNSADKASAYAAKYGAKLWQWGVINSDGSDGIVAPDGSVKSGSIDANIILSGGENTANTADVEIIRATATVNVRAIPSIKGAILGTLLNNSVTLTDPAPKIDPDDNMRWAFINYGGKSGYIADMYTRKLTGNFVPAVTRCAVKLRAAPSLSGLVRDVLPTGAKLAAMFGTVVTCDGYDWIPVRGGEDVGWCAGKYVKKA